MFIWYIYPALVCYTKKNPATLVETPFTGFTFLHSDNASERISRIFISSLRSNEKQAIK
jgi:hypothetical protein